MRRGMAFGAFAIAMALFCILTSQAAVARTVLFLNSQKGDYIGGGKRQALTTANGTFTLTWLQDTLIVQFNSQNIWGDMSIEAPQGETLAVGLYEDAQRARLGSPKKPGFAFSLTGRGCNGVRARFLISDILIDSDRTVKRLAVDFEQHCGFSAPALYGSFRYNSSVSTEPRISIGGTTALKGNAGTSDATILASLSMPSSSVVKARYRTADGTALGGTDYTPVSGTVVFAPGVTEMPITVPVIGNRNSGGNRVFTVTLEGVGTPVSDGVADVQLFDPNVPTTVLTLNSQKGAFVGTNPVNDAGRAWLITTADTIFTASRNLHGGVSLKLDGTDVWFVDMTGPDGQVLVPKTYRNAQRFPFEPAGMPGLAVSGAGRGCNTLTGGFVVNQVQYAVDGGVESFSADFNQRCYLYGGGPLLPGTLFGTVSVNAIPHQASVTNAAIVGRTAIFTITLNPASLKSETVQFSTRDGTALAGVDYRLVSQNVTFAPGETIKTVRVPLLVGAHLGKQFSGQLSATRTPLWIRAGSAIIK